VNGVLEIAAYCSLVVAMSLLVVKLFWPRLAPWVHAHRFRRTLGSAENILSAWTEEFRVQDEQRRHEQRHPEPTEDA